MDNYDLLSPEQLRMASRRMRTELDNLYKAGLHPPASCLKLLVKLHLILPIHLCIQASANAICCMHASMPEDKHQ